MKQESDNKKIIKEKDTIENIVEDSSNEIKVGNSQFYIITNRPCPEYTSLGTQAYIAKNTTTDDNYLALLTGDIAIPRFSHIPSLKILRSSHMLSLHHTEVVYIPSENKHYFACIFDIPYGQKIMAGPNEKLLFSVPNDYSTKLFTKTIIEPFLKLLKELKDVDITHGAINLNNIYALQKDKELHLQLGECLTSPHSYTQHAVFEPINRALAHPTARGRGTEKDDLYSLGMCVALIAIKHNPFFGLSEDEVIQVKTEIGSYMFIAREGRLPSGVSEFLRGVLNDEYSSRWSLEEAIKWMDGSRMTIKTPRPAPKASRPYIFMNKPYNYINTLVNDFVKNPSHAIQTLREKKFREWLHRNITDKSITTNFDKNFGSDKNLFEVYENKENLMLTHACISLIPDAPIRYRGVSSMPNGLGTGLAHAIMHKQDINPYLAILKKQIYNYWFDMQHIHIADYNLISSELEKARAFLRQKMLARGIERVVYMLCSESYCLSPTIKHLYVRDTTDLLLAFENLAQNDNLPSLDNFFDKHILAFLMEKDSKVIEPQLSWATSNVKSQKIIGLLRSFATMQKLSGNINTPNLFKWFLVNINPALNRIYDKNLKKSVANKIKKFSSNESFTELLEVIDDVDMIKKDAQNFALAKNIYKEIEKEKKLLLTKLKMGYTATITTGRQVAMVIATLFAIIIILLLLFFHFKF